MRSRVSLIGISVAATLACFSFRIVTLGLPYSSAVKSIAAQWVGTPTRAAKYDGAIGRHSGTYSRLRGMDGKKGRLPRLNSCVTLEGGMQNIASKPTKSRAIDLKLGKSSIRIPFNRIAGRHLLVQLDRVYSIYEGLALEAEENEEEDSLISSQIPDIVITESFHADEEAIDIEIVCDPNQGSSVADAKAQLIIRHGGVVFSGETPVEDLYQDLVTYVNMPKEVRIMPR